MTAIEKVTTEIDEVLGKIQLTADDREKLRGWAIEAGARYIASHPNGPLPRGENLVTQQWKKLHI